MLDGAADTGLDADCINSRRRRNSPARSDAVEEKERFIIVYWNPGSRHWKRSFRKKFGHTGHVSVDTSTVVSRRQEEGSPEDGKTELSVGAKSC